MKQLVNKEYKPIFINDPSKRYYILMGGRGAGRSTAASQFANTQLVAPEYFRCAIMRYILGDIRHSIYQEIIDRATENGVLGSLYTNDGTMDIEYGTNSINAVGFKKSSGEQKAKLKSLANYNCIIIEEADEIAEADFMQLDDSIRTLKGDLKIILLLNPPPRSHWIVKRFFNLLPSGTPNFYVPELKPELTDTVFIRTSFRNNLANLSSQTITRYEGYKFSKPDHYYNIIEGLVPEVVRGKIYHGWRKIDSVPPGARLISKGLDYGYANDPSVLVDIYYLDGEFIFDELTYTIGLSNRQLADIILQGKAAPVIPDSAEPKSNDELRLYGITVIDATKGKGSVSQGIRFVQAQKCAYTKRSVNIEKSYENYAWKINKDGEIMQVPNHLWSDGMDAIRYGLQIKSDLEPREDYKQPAYERPGLEDSPVAPAVDQSFDGITPHRRETQ